MQSLGCFIDFVSKHSVTRPIQNSRELVVSHSASLAELPLYGNPLSYWASTNSCSEPFFLSPPNTTSPFSVFILNYLLLYLRSIASGSLIGKPTLANDIGKAFVLTQSLTIAHNRISQTKLPCGLLPLSC